MNGKPWTEEELQIVRWLYPHVSTKQLADILGRWMGTVYQKANKLGLKKTEEYLASESACRLRRGDNVGEAYRFKLGQVPANKGLRRPGWAPGRMSETQFKPGVRQGVAARLWCPVGTIRPDPEGFLRIKIRENTRGESTGFGNVRVWPQLNRHVWEQHHGPIPAGHAIVFKDRNRANCDIGNLDCISRRELMLRNTVHNLPKDLVEVIQLTGVLKRKLRRREREEQAV